MSQQLINLNKEGVNFLFDHDLLSRKYNVWCNEFAIEFERISKMLDDDFNHDTQQYSTFLNTLIHNALHMIQFNSELGVIYIDVSKMNKQDAGISLYDAIKKYKQSLNLST